MSVVGKTYIRSTADSMRGSAQVYQSIRNNSRHYNKGGHEWPPLIIISFWKFLS